MNILNAAHRYNENWNVVRKAIRGIHVEPDRDDVFLCPLCFRCFAREQWNGDHLSVEHVPPKSMGGRSRTITCRNCNSRSGTELDAKLKQEQKFLEFIDGVPGSSFEGRYRFNGMESPLIANVIRADPSTWQIIGIPERTNPSDIQEIYNLHSLENINLSFQTVAPRLPSVARLRAAYLWAFSVFGYALLLNQGLLTVCRQIMHPNDKIIAHDWELTLDFPDDLLGVNIINTPKGMRGMLVCMKLRRPQGSTKKYSILLPRPDSPDVNLYSYAQQNPKGELSVSHIPDTFDFNAAPFAAVSFWSNS